MNQIKYILFGSLLLGACAQPSVRTTGGHAVEHAVPLVADLTMLPNIELSEELLYKFLLTEIASQRGEVALAVQGSSDLANQTHDPRLAMRSAQLALQAGQMDKAIEALKIWREVDPDSPLAMRMYASILMRVGKLDEARQELEGVLKSDQANAGHIFYQIYQMQASYPDKEAALKFMRKLAQPYSRVAEAHWAVAKLAQITGDKKLAIDEAQQARRLRPEWGMAISFEAFLLKENKPKQGLKLLSEYLLKHPDVREIRLQYARALLEQQQYEQAREEFQVLADDDPENPETVFAIALISLEMKDYEGAETYLKQALSKGRKDQDTVHYYLGQLGEANKNNEQAIEQYRLVAGGEYLFSAQIRITYLMSKSGSLDAALQHLKQIQASDDKQRAQLILLEGQLLREAGQRSEAYEVLQDGLAKLPDNPDLLYGTAMLADMIEKPDEFERMMRKLIEIQPDHAHAYNALGYGLLERNERIPEALQLVEKALQLAPDDPAIMDSVGWAYYLSGMLKESVEMLRRAFAVDPDPEIAAHLGEVLWRKGEKAEARKVWQNGLDASPDSTHLQDVIKKFIP